MKGDFVVLEKFVESFDGETVSWVGVVLAGLTVAVLAGAIAANELCFPLAVVLAKVTVTVVLVDVGVLDVVGELVCHFGLAGLVNVYFHGIARRKIVDPGSIFDVACIVLGGEVYNIRLGISLFLDDLVRHVFVKSLRFVLIIRNVFGYGGDLLLQLFLLFCVLILLENAVIIVMILLMEGIVIVPEDETVSVWTEANRSTEVVQFCLLLVSHFCVFPLASHPLGLDG